MGPMGVDQAGVGSHPSSHNDHYHARAAFLNAIQKDIANIDYCEIGECGHDWRDYRRRNYRCSSARKSNAEYQKGYYWHVKAERAKQCEQKT